MKKTCNVCVISKDDTEFYRDASKKDGRSGTCKQCANARTNNWIHDNRERLNKNHSDYQKVHPEKKRISNKVWIKAHPDRVKERDNSYRGKYPEKFHARQAVKYAIKVGKLIKQPCEVCGDKKSQAHHDDYSKQLDVRWLCVKHHSEIHN